MNWEPRERLDEITGLCIWVDAAIFVCNMTRAWISLHLVIDAVYLQVYASSLVDVERDYLSIAKRYPRLFVSPEFSKVSFCYLFSRICQV